MNITRRTLTAALSLGGLALAGRSPFGLIPQAHAQASMAAAVASPRALTEMALGPADAAVTIIEYGAPTCPHCAAFNEQVFPKIKQAYIDTGKIRYVFRVFNLNLKDAAAGMLARCTAKDDPARYFATLDLLFKQQDAWAWARTNVVASLIRIGNQAGLSEPEVEACLKDQAVFDKVQVDQKFAVDVLKIDTIPAFFVNGEKLFLNGGSFEDWDKRIKAMLRS